MNMKILFLTTRLPRPITDGRSYTLEQYITILASKFEVGVISLFDNKNIEKQDEKLNFVVKLKKTSFFSKIVNVFLKSFLLRKPIQTSVVYSRKNYKTVKKIITDFKPDLIICDMIRTFDYIRKINVKKILDMDDILSTRYLDSSKIKNYNSNALGQFEGLLPKTLVKVLNISFIKKTMLRFEYKSMLRIEKKSTLLCDKVVLVSPIETEKLKVMSGMNNVITWPVAVKSNNYINIEYDKNCICFIGNVDVSHNRETLNYLCKNILPKLSNNYKLLVIGKCSNNFKQNFSKYNNVKFVGYVNSLQETAMRCLCMVAPIQFGSGIKVKVLEAMAMGVPVVTSKIGVDGLSVKNFDNIVIAESDDEYVYAIENLHKNEFLRNKISLNSMKYVEDNNSYLNLSKVIFETIKDVMCNDNKK